MNSNDIVPYNNTELVAAAIQKDLLVDKNQLKKIRNSLPPGAEAVIQLVAVADLLSTEKGIQMYHAATIAFAVSKENKLNVSTTIASYAYGKYQTLLNSENEKEQNLNELIHSNAMVSLETNRDLVIARRHELICNETIDNLRSMQAKEKCPQAFTITTVIQDIFKEGIFLPKDESVHYCTFKVMVQIPGKTIQSLGSNYGIRGTMERMNARFICSSTLCQAQTLGNKDSQDLIKKFDKLKLTAKGEIRPDDVPDNAITFSRFSTGDKASHLPIEPNTTSTTQHKGKIEELE